MKIDYEITVDVRGMSNEMKMNVLCAMAKLGFRENPQCRNDYLRATKCLHGHLNGIIYTSTACGPTHTYTQLLELAGMTKKKQLTDLNSDELHTKLAKNTGKITELKLQNDEIVELLRSRALAPVDGDAKVALTVDELKGGGWYLSKPILNDAEYLAIKGISVLNGEEWGSGIWLACVKRGYRQNVVRTNDVCLKFKQIHRIGNEFYWGKP